MTKISFNSNKVGELAGRTGEFIIGDKKLRTPKFFPIINIITGSPGIFRTGGIWRGIKIELIQKARIDAFMTQILHFMDFNISKKMLDGWLEKPLDKRFLDEAEYNPTIFADSGGFKLLFTEGIDTSKYGFSPTPKEILNLQLKFGADFLATLDYPVPPNLSISETLDRKKMSIKNAIETLSLIKNKGLSDEKFVYIPVHGQDFSSSFRYVQDVLEKIKKNNLSEINFGLAIGSLVPLSSSYKKMVDIVAGVVQGVRDNKDFQWENIPIHAFGVTGFMMPVLSVMGIDSFDSSSYAQGANNLSYIDRFGTSGITLYNLEENEIECDCEYCKNFKNGSLQDIKKIMRYGKPYVSHNLNGKSIKKYQIYSWIACHNYTITEKTIQSLRKNIEKGKAVEHLLELYKHDNRMRLILGHLTKYYENLADNLLEYNLLRLSGKKTNFENVEWKKTQKIADVNKKRKIGHEKQVSLLFTPDDYNILNRSYQPKSKKVLLFTSCSKEKPYSTSRTIKSVKAVSDKWIDKIEIVVISGMYGPVPLSEDKNPAVSGYNYLLSTSNEKQMKLLSVRMEKFLDKYSGSFDHIVAYVTSKPYRVLIESLANKFRFLEVLPKNLKVRTGKEFTKKKNLTQLDGYLKKNLEKEEN